MCHHTSEHIVDKRLLIIYSICNRLFNRSIIVKVAYNSAIFSPTRSLICRQCLGIDMYYRIAREEIRRSLGRSKRCNINIFHRRAVEYTLPQAGDATTYGHDRFFSYINVL